MRQVQQALHDLRDKQNVTVKFVGFTDDQPLTGRNERIYGDHLALSKAPRAPRRARDQDALDLPTAAIASDGLGATRPIASNDTERGRALNRRVEVEFWYDDPLQELPDEPQPCPGEAGAEVVTKVYEPSTGPLAVAPDRGRRGAVPARLHRRPAARAGRRRPTRRDRGCASSATRATRRSIAAPRWSTATTSGSRPRARAGRWRRSGPRSASRTRRSSTRAAATSTSNDVVNAGFVQGDTSYVVVQVVYDELAVARRLRRRRGHAASRASSRRRIRSR